MAKMEIEASTAVLLAAQKNEDLRDRMVTIQEELEESCVLLCAKEATICVIEDRISVSDELITEMKGKIAEKDTTITENQTIIAEKEEAIQALQGKISAVQEELMVSTASHSSAVVKVKIKYLLKITTC